MQDEARYAEIGETAKEVEQAGSVQVALEHGARILSDVERAVERLSKRLEPVVSHRPQATDEVREDRASGAPLADEILRRNDRLIGVAHRLTYLLEILEV